MSAADLSVLRRPGDGEIVTLAKPVIAAGFQPIVEAATGAVFGYESLMQGFEKLGFRSPVDLLDSAHEAGQLGALEQMVNSRALAAFAALPDFRSRTLFLNLDSRLVGEGLGLVERLSGHLLRAGIPASSLCFEISERFENAGLTGFSRLLQALRMAGFKLAIDDFGVGHSGLKLLCDHPVDYLKIDRHFISGIATDARKRHLVRNTVNAAHVLGIRVVAEGVETEAELVAAREAGCDLIQGWFVSRPVADYSALRPVYAQVARAGGARHSSSTLDSILIRREIEQVAVLREDDSLEAAFELFRHNPKRTFFPVLNASDEPRGILHEYQVKELSYHPFGRDLIKNRLYRKGLSHFVTNAPIADLDTPAEQLLEVFTGTGGSECVILTENLRYAGILSASSLLTIINEKRLRTAEDQNPLTGLPGNRSISDYLQDRALDGDALRCLCYFDLDNFKPFNDRYGFQQGDAALTLFASLLRRDFVGEEAFVGHIGGDDFFAGISGLPVAAAQDKLCCLLEDFRREVHALYSPEDRQAGEIHGHDRMGRETRFPLMRCSVAVLALPEGEVIGDIGRISARITALKREAKESPEGIALALFSPAAA
ncbi:GGDEF domain-containing protein [Shinella daejeonensis]|uniref:GGDEF domain-containing protein n=1 Tax=Shinella daejeonensis TaxID=659017 RepID=UPI0020C79FAD|nr:GGDEF domain-containing protein [Shinella daejeonensis]MCP8897096.1 GGDEF domain-containing protein [Shinella daejeonensis]